MSTGIENKKEKNSLEKSFMLYVSLAAAAFAIILLFGFSYLFKSNTPTEPVQEMQNVGGVHRLKKGDVFPNDILNIQFYAATPTSYFDVQKQRAAEGTVSRKIFSEYAEYAAAKSEKPHHFSLADSPAPYRMIVFKSLDCPHCFSHTKWLNDIRREISPEVLDITVVYPPCVKEEDGDNFAAAFAEYIKPLSEDLKNEYMYEAPRLYRNCIFNPEGADVWCRELDLFYVPLTIVIDSNGLILLRLEGDPDEAEAGDEYAEKLKRERDELIEKIKLHGNR